MDDMTMIIDGLLLDKVTAQAKASPRLRMNMPGGQVNDISLN